GLLVEGVSAKDVSRRLFISEKTVGTHIEHILSKLNVKSRVQAVAVAFREGLAVPETTSGPRDSLPVAEPKVAAVQAGARRRRGKTQAAGFAVGMRRQTSCTTTLTRLGYGSLADA